MKLRQVLNKEDSERLLKFLNIDDRTEGHAFLLSPDPSKENRTKVNVLGCIKCWLYFELTRNAYVGPSSPSRVVWIPIIDTVAYQPAWLPEKEED